MGQENSHEPLDPNEPPRTLSSRTLPAIAQYIQDGRSKRIVVMTGAGISTSAGIPDFRSPDTGLYSNLKRLDLPYAEAVFDISYFKENPNPFYVLAKELYPGKFYPTVAHSFISLLEKKNMLRMLFTQNIDCLERRAGVSDAKIIEAHGSFATQRCIECKTEYPDDLMKLAVENADVPHCVVPQCNGLVKPDIVFFGEALPDKFTDSSHEPGMAELIIVMGTSLTLQPFASLPSLASGGVPRVLINKEMVGDFGSREDDVVILGDCDEGVRKLADALGWREELEALWFEVSGKFKEEEAERLREQRATMSKDEILEDEIKKLTGEVDETLRLTKEHTDWIKKGLEEESLKNSEDELKPDAGTKEPLSSPTTGTALTSVESLRGAGILEPPSTPASGNEPINGEKVNGGLPAHDPKVDTEAIVDATLPHFRPNADPAASKRENEKPVPPS